MSAIHNNQNIVEANDAKLQKISTAIRLFLGICLFFIAIRTTAGYYLKSMFMEFMKNSVGHGQPVPKPALFSFNFLHFLLTGGFVYEITLGMAGLNLYRYISNIHVLIIIRGIVLLFLSLMCILKVLARCGKIFPGNTSVKTLLSWIASIGCILLTPIFVVPGILAIIATCIDLFSKKNNTIV